MELEKVIETMEFELTSFRPTDLNHRWQYKPDAKAWKSL